MDDNECPQDIEIMHFLGDDFILVRDRETGFLVYSMMIGYEN